MVSGEFMGRPHYRPETAFDFSPSSVYFPEPHTYNYLVANGACEAMLSVVDTPADRGYGQKPVGSRPVNMCGSRPAFETEYRQTKYSTLIFYQEE